MTPLPILDLIAGLIFIYFLLSLINNSLFEIFSSVFKLRAFMLKEWLVQTFSNPSGDMQAAVSANEIMNHPLLNGLSKQDKATSYMDGKNFARTITDLITKTIPSAQGEIPLINTMQLSLGVTASGLPKKIIDILQTFIAKTNYEKALDAKINEIEHFEKQVTQWFDGAMERVGSRFKQRTFLFTFIFATLVTVVLNVDSLSLATYLYSNPEAREKWAITAFKTVADSATIKSIEKIRKEDSTRLASVTIKDTTIQIKVNQNFDSLQTKIKVEKLLVDSIIGTLNANLPIGWNDSEFKAWEVHPEKKIGGWLITILAMCLGAPFWFDILGKIANVRSSIKPLAETTKQKTKKP